MGKLASHAWASATPDLVFCEGRSISGASHVASFARAWANT